MLFNSYVFLGGFLPAALGGFALASRFGRTAAQGWLLLASLVFYGWWNVAFLPVLLVSIIGNFVVARMILARRGNIILVTGIALNLTALAWYKYLAAILAFWDVPFAAPLLPLGISFFTFTQIGYLLDCHAGMEQRRGPLDYALFVTFFPHLIAGPILNSRDILPEFAHLRLSSRNLTIGGGIFLIGLLKKTLLADPISTLSAPGFADPGMLTLLPAWRTALAWSLQLYFDFSGYSDMAVGLARMFNVTFPFNFDAPYKAASVIDYWQRWHISLTRFLMSTIHAPLTVAIMRRRRARAASGQVDTTNASTVMARASRAMTVFKRLNLIWKSSGGERRGSDSAAGFVMTRAVPILATMGLAGIWHGAGLTFVVFGLLHAGFLIINHAWRVWGRWRISLPVSIMITYLCVLTGAVIFRAPSMSIAYSLFAAMLGFHGAGVTWDARGGIDAVWLIGLYAIVWGAPTTQTIIARPLWRPTLPWAAAFGTAATLGLLSVGGTGEFLYFQF